MLADLWVDWYFLILAHILLHHLMLELSDSALGLSDL